MDDAYRWLEDVTGERALAWVRERDAETVAALTGGERFAALRDGIREVLDSDARIPYPVRRGAFRYNFWRDADHPRGLWRRTTPESYATDRPEWDVLLDVDALGADEGENWVWAGASVLRPEYRWALVELSRGGADATVVREFDLETRRFVEDGFTVPEAKTDIDWIDHDHVYVGTDVGPGSLTASGYPRTVRRWRRGTPLAEAPVVYEGKPDDVAVHGYHDDTEGFERDFVRRSVDFYRTEVYQLTAAGPRRVEVPDDAMVSVYREWMLVELRSAWRVGDRTFPAGALLATAYDAFMAGGRELTVLFEPDPHTSLAGYSWTRHHLILGLMHDVTSRVEVLTPAPSGPWAREPMPVPELSDASAYGTDADVDDEYLLDVDGFLQPSTLHVGTLARGPAHPAPADTDAPRKDAPDTHRPSPGTGTPETGTGSERGLAVLKRAPAFFDTAGLTVRQHFATSDDGTRVPYFVVGPDEPTGPTLLYGYGGFEVSWTPGYSGSLGRSWLARGGCFVQANLRGGGEYGPEWHSGALRENRRLVYQDCAAVARDLVARGIATPGRLGFQGGSNGGLLAGVMLTTYPELFGAVVSQVPLLDMSRYHTLLAGASWMAEYGDPDEPADWAFMAEFSPYHQIRPGGHYPPVLFTTSTRDDRVHPGHARKMVARMREYDLDVTYYENIEGGHGAAADNEQAAFMSALAYEFLWRHLT